MHMHGWGLHVMETHVGERMAMMHVAAMSALALQ
jgi:hypothetical protein